MNLSDALSGKTAFLFDFDGVVTDSEVYAFMTLRSLVKDNYGIDIDDEDIEFTIGLDSAGTAREMSRKYGIDLSPGRFRDLLDDYPVYYTEAEELKAFPHIEELFRLIRGNGWRLAIVSSTCYAHLEAALRRLGLEGYPEVIISGDRVVNHKPDPEPYLKGMEALGSDPASTVAIEDSPVGILSAKRAGIPVIAYRGSVVRQCVDGADASIEDYSEMINGLRMGRP